MCVCSRWAKLCRLRAWGRRVNRDSRSLRQPGNPRYNGTAGETRMEGSEMNQAQRERRHRCNVERINEVQLLVGTGDQARVDHEGTLLERARLLVEEIRSHDATEQGLAAFDRLLCRAEEQRDRGTARTIVAIIEGIWNDKPMRLSALRA